MLRVCITGCGRSGTLYIARFLRCCGLDVGHERLGADGVVGWFYAGSQEFRGYGRGRGSRFDPGFHVMLHQVRHPLAVIGSMVGHCEACGRESMSRTAYRFAAAECGELPPRVPQLPCFAAYWLEWNRLAASVCQWTYRIEDLLPGTATTAEWFARLGLPLRTAENWPPLKRTVNHRPHRDYTWADLADWPNLRSEIQEQAAAWGYSDV